MKTWRVVVHAGTRGLAYYDFHDMLDAYRFCSLFDGGARIYAV